MIIESTYHLPDFMKLVRERRGNFVSVSNCSSDLKKSSLLHVLIQLKGSTIPHVYVQLGPPILLVGHPLEAGHEEVASQPNIKLRKSYLVTKF